VSQKALSNNMWSRFRYEATLLKPPCCVVGGWSWKVRMGGDMPYVLPESDTVPVYRYDPELCDFAVGVGRRRLQEFYVSAYT
jgi:hypothetical protein